MIENSMLYRGIPKNKSDYEFLSKAYPENCKNGFVFGQPLIDKVKNRYYICVSLLATMNCTVANGTVTVIEVVPETINRYSTIMDSTGKFIFDGDQLQDYKITDKPRKRYLQAVKIDVDTGHNELVTICLPESFIDEMRQRFDEAMGATHHAN